jgi:hypothetical protein
MEEAVAEIEQLTVSKCSLIFAALYEQQTNPQYLSLSCPASFV